MESVSTRRGADELVAKGKVMINGKKALLGQKVNEGDKVEIATNKKAKPFRYYAYNKPKGVISHSAQFGEDDVVKASGLKGVFPIGRLDKDSHGLIILTDDGRITDKLLNPDYYHEKEYVVQVQHDLRASFKEYMEAGITIDDYTTKPCKVKIIGPKKFGIIITEGKKHQIRRMCEIMHNEVTDLKRTRIMNIRLADLPDNASRQILGDELHEFLELLDVVER
ncbi:MAG: rRNA pseudouridine synthase [Candidatus Vogelbacteria bacterium]|nr:rRNA pseudouridine synthase [Candidatus Vogelbacteria bacterium]